ncbi:MAG: hypothetical protein IJ109_10835 [Firmicutes bacterium]|nr:hypothetical protein [Bacillota bacterium]MBQ9016592.1 hypothetical protein [Bacillota bacterium]
MSKKYMSMQEELAARRAAGESREGAGEHSDLTASGHFERSSAAGRSTVIRRAAGSGRTGGSAGPKSPKAVAAVVLMIAAAAVSAIIGAYVHVSEPQPVPEQRTQATEWTVTTQTAETTRTAGSPKSEAAKINERSSLTEIYNYAEAHTEPPEDPNALYGQIYWDIGEIVDRYEADCTWYIHEGLIYVSPTCAEGEELQKLEKTWGKATKEIRALIETYEKDDAPIIIMVHIEDQWRLQLFMIDGQTEFMSESRQQ